MHNRVSLVDHIATLEALKPGEVYIYYRGITGQNRSSVDRDAASKNKSLFEAVHYWLSKNPDAMGFTRPCPDIPKTSLGGRVFEYGVRRLKSELPRSMRLFPGLSAAKVRT